MPFLQLGFVWYEFSACAFLCFWQTICFSYFPQCIMTIYSSYRQEAERLAAECNMRLYLMTCCLQTRGWEAGCWVQCEAVHEGGVWTFFWSERTGQLTKGQAWVSKSKSKILACVHAARTGARASKFSFSKNSRGLKYQYFLWKLVQSFLLQ